MSNDKAPGGYNNLLLKTYQKLNVEEQQAISRISSIAKKRKNYDEIDQANPCNAISALVKMRHAADSASRKLVIGSSVQMMHPSLPPQLQTHRMRLILGIPRPAMMDGATFQKLSLKAVQETEWIVVQQFMPYSAIMDHGQAGLRSADEKSWLMELECRNYQEACTRNEKMAIQRISNATGREVDAAKRDLQAIRIDIKELEIYKKVVMRERLRVEEVSEDSVGTYGVLLAYQELCQIHGRLWMDDFMEREFSQQWARIIRGERKNRFVSEQMVLRHPWRIDRTGQPLIEADQPLAERPRCPPTGTFTRSKAPRTIIVNSTGKAVSQEESLRILSAVCARDVAQPRNRCSNAVTRIDEDSPLLRQTLQLSLKDVARKTNSLGDQVFGADTNHTASSIPKGFQKTSSSNSASTSAPEDNIHASKSKWSPYGGYITDPSKMTYVSPYAAPQETPQLDTPSDERSPKRVRLA